MEKQNSKQTVSHRFFDEEKEKLPLLSENFQFWAGLTMLFEQDSDSKNQLDSLLKIVSISKEKKELIFEAVFENHKVEDQSIKLVILEVLI